MPSVREPALPADVPQPLDRELLAWAAGFFDGEGTTFAKSEKRRPGYFQLQVAVPQSGGDQPPEVLERFRDAALGTGRMDPRNPDGVYCWRARGRVDAETTLGLLWPYLGEVKRAQAQKAMSLVEAQYESGRYATRVARYRPTFIAHPTVSVVAGGSNVSERAWAAGILDAEGSFGLVHGGKRKRGADWYRIRVSANQHSSTGQIPDVLTRLQRVLGVGRIERHGEPTTSSGSLRDGRRCCMFSIPRRRGWAASSSLRPRSRSRASTDKSGIAVIRRRARAVIRMTASSLRRPGACASSATRAHDSSLGDSERRRASSRGSSRTSLDATSSRDRSCRGGRI